MTQTLHAYILITYDREIVKLHFDCVLLSFRWDKRGKELIAAQILNTAGNAALVDQDFDVSRTCLWCINCEEITTTFKVK